MDVLHVVFKTQLTESDVERVMESRRGEFLKVPGLVQKYYLRGEEPGVWSGFYLFDSAEDRERFFASDLRKGIGSAYKVEGSPTVRRYQVLFPLRTP